MWLKIEVCYARKLSHVFERVKYSKGWGIVNGAVGKYTIKIIISHSNYVFSEAYTLIKVYLHYTTYSKAATANALHVVPRDVFEFVDNLEEMFSI